MDSHNISDRLSQISDEFMKCSRAITAIGDETEEENKEGQRVSRKMLPRICAKN